jgi:hypothetical protein
MCQTNKTNKKIIILSFFIFISISWSTISSNTSLQVVVCLNLYSQFEMTLFILLDCWYFYWTDNDRVKISSILIWFSVTIYLIAWEFQIPKINKQYEISDIDQTWFWTGHKKNILKKSQCRFFKGWSG